MENNLLKIINDLVNGAELIRCKNYTSYVYIFNKTNYQIEYSILVGLSNLSFIKRYTGNTETGEITYIMSTSHYDDKIKRIWEFEELYTKHILIAPTHSTFKGLQDDLSDILTTLRIGEERKRKIKKIRLKKYEIG